MVADIVIAERVRTKADPSLWWIKLSTWVAISTSLFTSVTGEITLVRLGSYNFQTAELLLAVLLATLVHVATRHGPVFNLLSVLLWAFVALQVVGLLRGLVTNQATAIVSLRANGGLPVLLLLATYLPNVPGAKEAIPRIVVYGAMAACVVSVARLIFGVQLWYLVDYTTAMAINDGGRVISNNGALMIGAGAIIGTTTLLDRVRSRTSRLRNIATPAAMMLILPLTFQGSATLGTLMGFLGFFALMPGKNRAVRQSLFLYLVGCGLVIFVIAPEFYRFDWVGALLSPDTAEQLMRRTANLGTREAIWDGLMAGFPYWEATDQVFGHPFGQFPLIVINEWGGIIWTLSIHSMYFGLLVTSGVAGLGIYLLTVALMLITLCVKAIRFRNSYAALGASLLLILLVFGYGYDLRNEHGIILAVAIAGALSRTRPTSVSGPAG